MSDARTPALSAGQTRVNQLQADGVDLVTAEYIVRLEKSLERLRAESGKRSVSALGGGESEANATVRSTAPIDLARGCAVAADNLMANPGLSTFVTAAVVTLRRASAALRTSVAPTAAPQLLTAYDSWEPVRKAFEQWVAPHLPADDADVIWHDFMHDVVAAAPQEPSEDVTQLHQLCVDLLTVFHSGERVYPGYECRRLMVAAEWIASKNQRLFDIQDRLRADGLLSIDREGDNG